MTGAPALQQTLVRKVFSRILHSYFRITRGLTLGVRAVVRSSDGKFLLVRHTYTPGWHLPGGGVEKGEFSEGALIKEIQQETGLNVLGRPQLLGIFYNRGVSDRDHVLLYSCETTGELSKKGSILEIAEVRYFGIEELPNDIDPGTERRIQEINLGQLSNSDW